MSEKRCFGYPGNVEKNVRKVSLFDVFLFFAYTVRTTRKNGEQNIAKYQGMYDAEVILDDDLLYRAGNASYGREKRSRERYPSRFPSEKK